MWQWLHLGDLLPTEHHKVGMLDPSSKKEELEEVKWYV